MHHTNCEILSNCVCKSYRVHSLLVCRQKVNSYEYQLFNLVIIHVTCRQESSDFFLTSYKYLAVAAGELGVCFV